MTRVRNFLLFTWFSLILSAHIDTENLSVENPSVENLSVENLSVENLSVENLSVENLSVEEKVGQLLMVSVTAHESNPAAHALVKDLSVGGIIYYTWANGLDSTEQVTQLSKELQNLAAQTRTKIPLIIAIDHEGGRVHRFAKGCTHFPPAFAYGLADNTVLTEESGFTLGKELRAVGITMNFAPVADILSNLNNPGIGTRAFGTTPVTVTTHCRAFMQGLHRAGCMTSLKHFPGHGDTSADSHVALPIINKSLEELRSCEFVPFYALAGETDSIMTGHLMVPAIDPHTCSTLSKPTLKLLREQAHFDGVIISDSLVMQGVIALSENISQSALKAINAGCDMLLIGGRCLVGSTVQEVTCSDIAQVHTTLVQAVQNGSLSRERLDSAVSRILKLKKSYALASPYTETDLDTHEHHQLASGVASRALNALQASNQVLPPAVHESLKTSLTTLMETYS